MPSGRDGAPHPSRPGRELERPLAEMALEVRTQGGATGIRQARDVGAGRAGTEEEGLPVVLERREGREHGELSLDDIDEAGRSPQPGQAARARQRGGLAALTRRVRVEAGDGIPEGSATSSAPVTVMRLDTSVSVMVAAVLRSSSIGWRIRRASSHAARTRPAQAKVAATAYNQIVSASSSNSRSTKYAVTKWLRWPSLVNGITAYATRPWSADW